MKKLVLIATALLLVMATVLVACNQTVYTVKFETGGGEQLSDLSYKAGDTLTLPTPTREGFAFGGWFVDEALTTAVTEEHFAKPSDVTLYAKWTTKGPQTFAISFVTNGGTDLAATQWTQGNALTVPETSRDGYTLEGWYYDAALQNKIDLASPSFKGDATIYAKWTQNAAVYVVNFALDGGTLKDGAETITSKEWTEGTKLILQKPVKEDFDFEGWFYDEQLKNAADLAALNFTSNGTLYAKWSAHLYELRVYSNETDYVSFRYLHGETVDISQWGQPTTTYEGETIRLKYWSDEPMADGDAITENFAMPARSMAVYPVFAFENSGGFVVLNDGEKYVAENSFAMLTFQNETQYGVFEADVTVWVKSGTNRFGLAFAATPLDVGGTWPFGGWLLYLGRGGNYRLTPIYKDWQTIPDGSADGNKIGADAAGASTSAEYKNFIADTDSQGRFTMHVKIQYTPDAIKVWFDGEENPSINYSGEYLNIYDGKHVGIFAPDGNVIFSNVRYVAPQMHSVSFETNGGTAIETTTVVDGSPLPNVETQRQGFTFTGWYSDASLTEKIDVSTFRITQDATLYAGWRERTFVNVSFETNGGASISPLTWEVGTPLEVETTRANSSFEGWYLDAKATQKFEWSDCSATGDFTLYAEWTENINGFCHYVAANKYVSLKNTAAVIQTAPSQYGTWQATLTLTKKARVGLLVNGTLDDTVANPTYSNSLTGYVVYFNVGSSGTAAGNNVTLNVVKNKYPDPDGGFTSTGKSFASIFGDGTANYQKMADFDNGTSQTVTFDLAIEITPQGIYVYADGQLFCKNENVSQQNRYEGFGLGIFSDNSGTTFENLVYAPNPDYTVSFETNGASEIASQTVANGAKPTAVQDPERQDYTFAGWFLDEQLQQNAIPQNVVINGNTTFYAKWVPIEKYVVSFNTNGGSAIADLDWLYGSAINVETTLQGWTLEGWYYDEDLTDKADLGNVSKRENFTLYAEWTRTENNFLIYKVNERYVAQGNGSFIAVENAGLYGKWEMDVTVTGNSKMSILFNARIGVGGKYLAASNGSGNGVYGYVVYLNFNGASAADNTIQFTTSYDAFSYLPGGTKGAAITSAKLTNNGYAANAFETLPVTVHFAIERTADGLSLYVDGRETAACSIKSSTGKAALFDEEEGCTGVGFSASGAGLTFSNCVFTPAEGQQNSETESNASASCLTESNVVAEKFVYSQKEE